MCVALIITLYLFSAYTHYTKHKESEKVMKSSKRICKILASADMIKIEVVFIVRGIYI